MPDSNPILDVFAYLRVRDPKAAIAFYGQAFGAIEEFRLTEPGGRIGHAELKFGSQTVMLSDEYPEYGIFAPHTAEGTGAGVHLHCRDVDELFARAIAAGATAMMTPTDMFYGERAAKVKDPFGHEWLLGSAIEEVSPEEMQRRFTAMFESPEESAGDDRG